MNFTPITATSCIEFLLWTAAFFTALRSKSRITLLSFRVFLAVGALGSFILFGLCYAQQFPNMSEHLSSDTYLGAYWLVYLSRCVALFFVLRSVFLHIMATLPNLRRIGSIVFYWAAITSLVVSAAPVAVDFATAPMNAHLTTIVAGISFGLSVMALSLLGFLIMCIRALNQSFRSWTFGICLGCGVMALTDLAASAYAAGGARIWPYEAAGIATLAALGIWIAYTLIPEKQEQPKAAVSSTLAQWNDLAQELGSNAHPQAAVPQNGFLQNVESVVDRVLAKNSVGSAG